MENRQELHDLPYTELIGLKASAINREDQLFLAGAIDRILRLRVNNFRAYLDQYDQLTPEQKEIAEPCIIYRMQLGPQNYTPESAVEPSLLAERTRTQIASRMATTAFQNTVSESVARIRARNEQEELEQDFIENFGYRPDGSEA
jgi:hypothetical protein